MTRRVYGVLTPLAQRAGGVQTLQTPVKHFHIVAVGGGSADITPDGHQRC